MKARNKCIECEYVWHDLPGGLATHNECPKCSSKYWKWENYTPRLSIRELAKKHGFEPRSMYEKRRSFEMATKR